MIQRDRAVSLAFLVALHLLSACAQSSSASLSSCPFSNAADEDHSVHSHGHAHDDDHFHHAHGHDHIHDVHDHGHNHAHDHGCNHDHDHDHGCNHDHHYDHTHSHDDHIHQYRHDHAPTASAQSSKHKLAEELAEEEELRLYGFKSNVGMVEEQHHHHRHDHHRHSQPHAVTSIGLWMRALGCSLLVSMASLICLIILPLIVSQGKPSRTVVDFLAAFGAGAMLGDAFLHQLPHALANTSGHGHSHGHYEERGQSHDGAHGHTHSIQDLSVGLAVLAGIILFFVVEKIVRQVEKASSKGMLPWTHHHYHHHREDEGIEHLSKGHKEMNQKPPNDDARVQDTIVTSRDSSLKQKSSSLIEHPNRTDDIQETEATKLLPEKDETDKKPDLELANQTVTPNLILGYLNLFSDGVHNFTDGMALGAAFLNHGTLGGWSRTLFLLAHELPQEVGDFGILVQSGFSVLKALAFNFLSALVALAGTVVALILGGNPGHSSLIEGFTAGGFIYIAVAGVLPEMHQQGASIKTTFLQLIALSMGMCVALTISLVE